MAGDSGQSLSEQAALNSGADKTHSLRLLMQRVGLSSFRELGRQAGVSLWQIRQLRQGQLHKMRLAPLLKLSQALELSLEELLVKFAPTTRHSNSGDQSQAQEHASNLAQQLKTLELECQRLEAQLAQQRQTLQVEFQQASLQVLESWLRQWPNAALAAQQKPELSAAKLLPLLRPVEQLIQQWGVEMIAPIGAEVPYDPRWHQLQGGSAQPGDRVQVRRAGYRQADKLLYRAEVCPLENA